jgi:hypothetical protein
MGLRIEEAGRTETEDEGAEGPKSRGMGFELRTPGSAKLSPLGPLGLGGWGLVGFGMEARAFALEHLFEPRRSPALWGR